MKSLLSIGIILIVFMGTSMGCDRIPFDSEEWKNWKESEAEPSLRWNMITDLISQHKLEGMTINQVIELFGEPEIRTKYEFYYYLGYSERGINTGSLILRLENGTVVKYEIFQG